MIMGCEGGTKQLLERMPHGDESDNQNTEGRHGLESHTFPIHKYSSD